MTSISQWLAAEDPDKTEPAGFYSPGARDWDDSTIPLIRAALRRRHNEVVREWLRVTKEWFEEE